MRRPVARPGRSYVILARDPVARFVSAFNWRKHLYRTGALEPQAARDPISELRQRAEKEFLFQFEDANALAEELVLNGSYEIGAPSVLVGLIGHVPRGFHWYLGGLLEEIEPRQISGIICTEQLSGDFERVFGFRPTVELNVSKSKKSTVISPKGREHLAREFHFEYATLKKLSAMADEAGIPMSMRYDPGLGAFV